MRKFPFALSLGTDICHISRIHKILESSRGARFVQRILNDEERRHPKIQCILNNGPSASMGHSASDETRSRHTGIAAACEKNTSVPTAAPNLDELRLAATFMAGR